MNDKSNIISALDYLNVAELDRSEWIAVGMALKEEGYHCDLAEPWQIDFEHWLELLD